MSRAPLTAEQLAVELTALPAWTGDNAGISRTATLASFPAAIRLVDEVARIAEVMDHHPDIDIRWRTVRFGCRTHSAGGVTALDLALAHRIDAALSTAAGAGGASAATGEPPPGLPE